MRVIDKKYQDPIEIIWVATAAELGINVVRSSDAFATWDGAGTLKIGINETLDADDSLAQMIFHEICHAAVAGPNHFASADWGLDNDNPDDVVQEHACLRLQAALAGNYGLARFMAATTDFQEFYLRIMNAPLNENEDRESSISLAQQTLGQLRTSNWFPVLDRALTATAKIASQIQEWTQDDSLWRLPTHSKSPELSSQMG